MRAHHSLPIAVWPLTAAACLAFGGLAVVLGMDAGADLRGHQYYSGWALLNGLTSRDLAVAGTDGFQNPLVYAAYVFLAEVLPPQALGFMIGMTHGLIVPLLFAICWRTLDVRNPNRRMIAASALAVAGSLGSASLALIGTAALDNVVSLGILAAVLGVVGNWEGLADDAPPTAALIAGLAGIPAGLALGLKPSMGIVCIGLVLAFPFGNMPMMRRLWLAAWFLLGMVAGTALSGGWWMAHLWRAFENPVFPFLNHLFHAPWAAPVSYLDRTFLPKSVLEALALPFRFPFDPALVSETAFRDYRALAVVLFVPLAGLVTAFRRDRDPGIITLPGPSGFLMAAAFFSLTIWVLLSGRYRHLVAFEILAPLAIIAAVGTLPLPRAGRRLFAASVVVFVTATTLPPGSPRAAWPDKTMSARIPGIEQPAATLVLLSGRERLSFLIPSFPKESRFIHLDAELPLAEGSPLGDAVRDAVTGHPGVFAALHATTERDAAAARIAAFGLELDRDGCRAVTSPLTNTLFDLCAVRRPMPDAPAGDVVPQPAADMPSATGESGGSAGSPAQP